MDGRDPAGGQLDGAVGPRIESRQQGGCARHSKTPGRVVIVVHEASLREALEVWHGAAGIAMQLQVGSRPRIEDEDQDVRRVRGAGFFERGNQRTGGQRGRRERHQFKKVTTREF